MMCDLVFDGARTKCARCGRNYRGDKSHVRAECFCFHLGPPIQREGITIKVKCGCNGGEHEQPHTAHECTLYKRCLPTLRPTDMAAWLERKPESDIYHLCHGCDRGVNQET